MYKYPPYPLYNLSQIQITKYLQNIQISKMPKIYPKDKLLFTIDTARRALIQGRSILEELTDDKDPAETIQKNLDYSYKQWYNNHLAQLHYIG